MKTLLILIALPLFAADPPKPTITPELRAKWWRSVAEASTAQVQLEKATAALNETRALLLKTCDSTGQQLAANAQGEPECVDKPKPTEAPKDKKPQAQ